MELDTWNWVGGTIPCYSRVVIVNANLMRECLFSLQLCHVAIWGSIASWFIFLLIYCIPGLALYIAPDMIGQVWNLTSSRLFNSWYETSVHVVLFIRLVLTFKSVHDTLVCDHSNESY